MRSILLILLSFYLLLGCANKKPLNKVLNSQTILKEVASNKEKYKVQIIYTRIDKDRKGNLVFKSFKFNVDTAVYFYPASTVKLLVSAFAIEKIAQEVQGDISLNTPLKEFRAGPCQSNIVCDSTAPNYTPSLGHYIHKMLTVSDNWAYNSVFDYLGQDYCQKRLTELGFPNARIIQRFDPVCNTSANRLHHRFEFYHPDSTFILSSTAITSSAYFNPIKNVGVGQGYYSGDSLINQAKQFRYNNNLPIESIHQALIRIFYPAAFAESQQFKLPSQGYSFLKSQLGMYPYESQFPTYDSTYYAAYKKYLYYGKSKNAAIDSSLRIYNIVGQAYGFTTDVGYFEDTVKKIAFFLSATIYTNADGILNDDKYEYDTIAFPFMKALGEAIYQRECKRKHINQR